MKNKKKVIYLIGAGATHSEVRMYDNTFSLLTRDIAEGISYKISHNKISGLSEVVNELASENIDIEQLITLYETSGFLNSQRIATKLRKAFMGEISERLKKLPYNHKPVLLSALIDMYDVMGIDEELQGFLTLNYDSFIELAAQNIKRHVNLLLLINNKNPNFNVDSKEFPILKLHGSFDWKNEFPITLTNENEINNDVLWIPPGVIKKREQYPFSLLWGKAKELLHCDILRVIGCSLNRNDWELVSLLQTAQRFSSRRKKFIIELIDYDDVGKKKKAEYPYLNIITILEIEGFKKYLLEDISTTLSKDGDITQAFEDYINNKTNINIFELWLRWRGDKLKNSRKDIRTSQNSFKNFVEYKYENA